MVGMTAGVVADQRQDSTSGAIRGVPLLRPWDTPYRVNSYYKNDGNKNKSLIQKRNL